MRKELKEFVARMDGNTTLDEIETICQNGEELNFVLENLKNVKPVDELIVLPLSLRLRAKVKFKDVPTEEITTILVQKKLKIGYSKAYAVKEWLVKSKGER